MGGRHKCAGLVHTFLMDILYIGAAMGTSQDRADALRRIGHAVFQVDPYGALGRGSVLSSLAFKTGGLGFESLINAHVLRQIGSKRFDIAWIDNGDLIGPRLLRALRERAPMLINLNLDNPFTDRDGHRWRLFRKALPHYDLFVTPRDSSVEAARSIGARRAVRRTQAADEVRHRPMTLTPTERQVYGCEVVFVGTWMPERGPFMARLLELGLPLRIHGPRWDRAPEYDRIKSAVGLSHLLNQEEYTRAIAGAKIALAMLSVENKDIHTTRSLEIPAIGTLLCAPRTSDHLAMYLEGEEAVFWDDADECASHCLALLADPERIARIADAGRRRVIANAHFNESLVSSILAEARSSASCADPLSAPRT